MHQSVYRIHSNTKKACIQYKHFVLNLFWGILLYSVGGGLLSKMGRNIIELLSTLAGQGSSTLGVLGLLHETKLGELLKNVAIDLASTQSEVVWSTTESLWTSEDLSQGTNTNVWSDVDATSNGCSASIHPISIIRSELLECSSLDDVNPLEIVISRTTSFTYLWDLELSLGLQMLSVSSDEVLSGNVLEGLDGEVGGHHL